jgi:hypothetical protein
MVDVCSYVNRKLTNAATGSLIERSLQWRCGWLPITFLQVLRTKAGCRSDADKEMHSFSQSPCNNQMAE